MVLCPTIILSQCSVSFSFQRNHLWNPDYRLGNYPSIGCNRITVMSDSLKPDGESSWKSHRRYSFQIPYRNCFHPRWFTRLPFHGLQWYPTNIANQVPRTSSTVWQVVPKPDPKPLQICVTHTPWMKCSMDTLYWFLVPSNQCLWTPRRLPSPTRLLDHSAMIIGSTEAIAAIPHALCVKPNIIHSI